jgi:acetyltransferase EpsM
MDALIIGAGAQGRVVADILLDAKRGTRCRIVSPFDSVEFIDDNPALLDQTVGGIRVSGGIASLAHRKPGSFGVIVALGHPMRRLQVAQQLREMNVQFLNAIHPSAVIMPSARLGIGLMIHPGAIINTGARLGDHIIVNSGSIIEHDCLVEDGVTILAGVRICGRVQLARFVCIASGAVIIQRRKIGEGSVVAAGAVVTRDVPPHVLVMGIPAKVREEVGPDFDWNRLL